MYLDYSRSSRKLTLSSQWLIIILAVLCYLHETEELSVHWDLQSVVHFRKTAILNCTINEKSNVCQNHSFIWRWTKYRNQNILIFDGNSSNKSKYTEEKNENCTESSLHIQNFSQSDFAFYTCSCGMNEYSKVLKPDGRNLISIIFSCSHSSMTLEMEIQNSSKASICYSTIENGRLNHKRIRTNLTGDLYNTEDTLKFVLNDHSCSGTIHSFCRFENTAGIEVFTRTYDCCTDHHNSVVLMVAIGFAIVIIFVVIICFVHLCRKKIKDCTRDCFHGQGEADNLSVVPFTSIGLAA